MRLEIADATIEASEHVNAASTSQTVPIFELPPAAFVIAFGARVTTAFAGVTGPNVQVGVSGETDKYMRQQSIGSTGDLIAGWAPNAMTYCEAMTAGGRVGTEANRSIIATFGSSSGNLSSLSAGVVKFYLIYAV